MIKENAMAGVSALCIFLYLACRYLFEWSVDQSNYFLFPAFLVGGAPLLFEIVKKAFELDFGSDILAGISIITSLLLGEHLAGAIVVLMLSGGSALEQYATRRAASVLHALAKRMPRSAHRMKDQKIEDVDVDQIQVGDRIVVFPHEVCPVDGTVIEGRGSMDESYLTGEPFQISKLPGTSVLSGAINGEGALTIEVEKLPIDSRYTKIVRVMEEAERNRPPLRRVGDRLGGWYTLIALIIAGAGWIVSGDSLRFLSVLVIATPCPLLIAIPVAIIGAISQAAARGIIVKDPSMLERIDSCRTFIFDKTGTLTYGKPSLTEIIPAPTIDRNLALQLTASVEQFSKHPLSPAILALAQKENVSMLPVSEISEKPGAGLQARVHDMAIEITGRKQALLNKDIAPYLPPSAPGMECVLLINNAFGAVFRFHDEPRTESRAFIDHLGPKHAASKVMLLSGDRKDEVTYLAGKVGITNILFGKSPEEKVEIVRAETKLNPTLFVGDGINDAPSMQAATVGVAFGQNSDITAEAADAVVMDASLGKVDEIIHIGRRMKRIAMQSAFGGMACSMIGMFVAAAGFLPPVSGALAQEVIDIFAVLNALRVVLPGKNLSEI